MATKSYVINSFFVFLLLIPALVWLYFSAIGKMEEPNPNDYLKQEFPLSKATIWIKKLEAEKAIEKSNWMDMGSGFTIKPKEEKKDDYFKKVNKNGQLEKLVSLYADEGFSWDQKSGNLKCPTKSDYVLIPTWILYDLIESDCFDMTPKETKK